MELYGIFADNHLSLTYFFLYIRPSIPGLKINIHNCYLQVNIKFEAEEFDEYDVGIPVLAFGRLHTSTAVTSPCWVKNTIGNNDEMSDQCTLS